MVSIYCIEDINDLKYVGSTIQKLNRRFLSHKYGKENNKGCSSQKLNLYNCIIYELEKCNESNRKERERYWINHIDTVNENKLNFDKNEHNRKQGKEYYQKIKEKKKQYRKEHYKNNKDEINFFRSKKVVNGCYEFIKMLEGY